MTLACRSKERGERVLALCRADADAAGHRTSRLRVAPLDVSSLDSVRAFAAQWARGGAPVHVLVNNAGIFDMGTPTRSLTVDGFESHLGTNHLGPFLLTLLLLPWLRDAGQAGGARVVNVVSIMHRVAHLHRGDMHLECGYSPALAYGQSKLAGVMATAELRRRVPESWGVTFLAAHPGNIASDVSRTLPRAFQWGHKNLLGLFLLDPSEGARASVWCAAGAGVPELVAAAGTDGYVDQALAPQEPSARSRDEGGRSWLWEWSAAATDAVPSLAALGLEAAPTAECIAVVQGRMVAGQRRSTPKRGAGPKRGRGVSKSPARGRKSAEGGERGRSRTPGRGRKATPGRSRSRGGQ